MSVRLILALAAVLSAQLADSNPRPYSHTSIAARRTRAINTSEERKNRTNRTSILFHRVCCKL